MDRAGAIARIQQGLSFRKDLDDEILAALEAARVELETGKTLPLFLLVEDGPLVLAAGTNSISLPTGFIRQEDLEPLRYTPTTSMQSRRIPWKPLGDAISAYGSSQPGGPKVAVLRQTTIQIFPNADTDYSLTWSYYAHSEEITSDTGDANAWLVNCPDAIIGEAGLRMAADLEDDAASAKFQMLLNKGKAQYLSEKFAREEAGGPFIMGANN